MSSPGDVGNRVLSPVGCTGCQRCDRRCDALCRSETRIASLSRARRAAARCSNRSWRYLPGLTRFPGAALLAGHQYAGTPDRDVGIFRNPATLTNMRTLSRSAMGALCHLWKIDSRVSHLINSSGRSDNPPQPTYPFARQEIRMATKPKTIIVTGASQGIGAAAANLFLDRGYNVVGNSRRHVDGGAHLGRW
jgi:hypothetical protein